MSIENAKAFIALTHQDNALREKVRVAGEDGFEKVAAEAGLSCDSSQIEEAYKLLDDGLWSLPAGTVSVSAVEGELSDEERAEHRWLLDTMAQLARDGEDATQKQSGEN